MLAASAAACVVVAGLFGALLMALDGRTLSPDDSASLEAVPYAAAALGFTFVLFARNGDRARWRFAAVAVLVGIAVGVGAGMHGCSAAPAGVGSVRVDAAGVAGTR